MKKGFFRGIVLAGFMAVLLTPSSAFAANDSHHYGYCYRSKRGSHSQHEHYSHKCGNGTNSQPRH